VEGLSLKVSAALFLFSIVAQDQGKKENSMRELHIYKPCLISMSESRDRLILTVNVLEQFSGQTPIFSKERYTIRPFGIRRNEKIAIHYTAHGSKAEEILEIALQI
jgi:large subunit ribosomal protein L11e